MSYTVNLGERNLDQNEVGAKAFNLSVMKSHGIPVPAGFVVFKDAYKKFKADPAEFSKIRTELLPKMGQFNSKFVMVRSSAVGEDGADHSFAGQLDSYKSENNIDSVMENLKKCWASLDNNRAAVYQQTNQTTLGGIAVIIQEMIEPDYAGVLFTSAPNGEDKALLEYVEGHAEKLVQGEVTPKTLYLDAETGVQPVNVKSLLKLSTDILKIYNQVPQDIEWAEKSGVVYIVQSRPITSIQRKISWSNANVNENYPYKLPPLLYSVAKESYYHYFRNVAHEVGAVDRLDSRLEKSFRNIIGQWGYKMYYNMSAIHAILQDSPVKNFFKTSFDDFVGYQEDKKSRTRINFTQIYALARLASGFLGKLFALRRRVETFERITNSYAESSASAEGRYHEFLNIRFNLWSFASFADLFAMITHGILGKICAQISTEKSQGIQNGVIQAIPNLVSYQPIVELWTMCRLITAESDDRYAKLFAQDSAVIVKRLASEGQYAAMNALVQDYLKNWGFRCSGELTLVQDNYIEKPENFIEMFKAYLNTKPQDPEILFKQKRNEQKQILATATMDILKNYKFNPLKAFALVVSLRVLTSLTCFAVSCRERVRLKQAMIYHHFKQACLEIADNLMSSGLLVARNDIFYLEFPEITRVLAGEQTDWNYYQSLIATRKTAIEAAEEFPDNFYTYAGDSTQRVHESVQINANEAGVLTGLPACGGVIKGRAVVLENIHEIHKLTKGDILVTKQTDPGWICVFPMISGLIVERGGMLSHGAIVAREFGIPAVVGVRDALKLIKDGQIVTVDGDRGVVRCPIS